MKQRHLVLVFLAALVADSGAPLIEAAPSVPKTENRSQAVAQSKPEQMRLQACLAEATSADAAGWGAAQAALSADAEATQLATPPDFAIAARESQAVFHHCLQRQLNRL